MSSANVAVPDRLARAFEGRTSLNLAETADALEMDEKTLLADVKRGAVKYVLRGNGQRRKLRRFLLADLLAYLEHERRQECPYTSAPTPRNTGANSGSKVIGFASLRARLNGVPPSSPKRG